MAATLLLADDSVTIQRVIELTFADEDIRVLVASDGQQAIQRIESDRPDIVLADIGMPRVDGYDVARHVKQSAALKQIPVLLLTGAFEPIDEARARATGCDGVLVKPFEPQRLVSKVKELLGGGRGAEMWPADMPRTVTPPEPVFAGDLDPIVEPDPALEPAGEPAGVSVFDLSQFETEPAEPAQVMEGDEVAHRFGDHAAWQSRPDLPPPADRLDSELDMLDAALSRLDPTAHPQELDAATASDFARDLNELRNEARLEEPQTTRPAKPSFGDWDLPAPPAKNSHDAGPIDLVAEEIPLAQPVAPVTQAPPSVVHVPPSAPIIHIPVEVSAVEPAAPPPAAGAPLAAISLGAPPLAMAAPVASAALPVPAPIAATPVAPTPVPPMPAAPMTVAPTPVAPVPAAPLAAAPIERPTLAAAFSALLAAEKSHPATHTASPQISEAAIEDVVRRVLARMAGETVNRVVLETAERLIREEIARTKDPSGR